MSADSARRWLVVASFCLITAEFAFFLLAPAFGYPLSFDQSIRILEVLFPVFLGYLGTATHFLFSTKSFPAIRKEAAGLAGLLVRGPVVLFAFISIVALIAFGYTNRAAASTGTGMNIDMLALVFSFALGVLAVTTTALVGYLFGSHGGESAQ